MKRRDASDHMRLWQRMVRDLLVVAVGAAICAGVVLLFIMIARGF